MDRKADLTGDDDTVQMPKSGIFHISMDICGHVRKVRICRIGGGQDVQDMKDMMGIQGQGGPAELRGLDRKNVADVRNGHGNSKSSKRPGNMVDFSSGDQIDTQGDVKEDHRDLQDRFMITH